MVDFATFGLFGERVSGSITPQIYNAFFEELNIPAVYIPFPVEKERFITALPVLRSDFSGFNVESPYRLDIAVHADKIDDTAKTIGAVNTVKVENGKMTAYNTDAIGFERSLAGFIGNLYDKDVLLIGSGGAAYGVANILLKRGAFLTIISRNITHATKLMELLSNKFNKNRVRVLNGLTSSDVFYAAFNATGVDIEGKKSEISIHTNTYNSFRYVYDLCIWKTAFLKKAEDFGADIKDGFDMLFYQSVGSLEIWLGKDKGPDFSAISKVYDSVKSKFRASGTEVK